MATVKDYYDILGVNETASPDEIKQAFREQAKQYRSAAEPGARDLKEAYDILMDPSNRKRYDDFLRAERKKANHTDNVEQRWAYLTLLSSRNYGTTKYYVNGEQQPHLKNGKFHEVINILGSEGWELVGISSVGNEQTYVFKQPTDEIFERTKDKPAS